MYRAISRQIKIKKATTTTTTIRGSEFSSYEIELQNRVT